ncbi:putative serine/threonine-protein kinase NAK [Dorcoceras hygrometricum]|uniref:Putative serine/threonine-protein kinase NAK n=1 Tax=Dorcoceras hygrometricum TaxID=472368 RepID=A0A2Z7BJH9_9LAMI|nr:putative serine/threonine-protein kinase NAK [Dorcoceras hygrometricum]
MDKVLGHHERLLKQLQELRIQRYEEKKALEIKLESTKARAKGEIKSLHSEVNRLKVEVENAWNLGKEKFLKNSRFNTLCSDKASIVFECGFNGCLAQFGANEYSERGASGLIPRRGTGLGGYS